MTLLEITNEVLRRLREDQVTTLANDDYAQLVASFVADIVVELNELTIWNAHDHEVTVSVVPGTVTYALTGTNEKSMLLFDQNERPQAWVFDDSNDPDGEQMFYIDPATYYNLYNQDRDQTNTTPYYFTLEKDTDNENWVLRLWPEPELAKFIRVRFNTPNTELIPDETDEDTNILLPARVVRLGALWLALNERGEEIGEPGNIAERRYMEARGAAVEEEIRARERAGFYDWSRN